MDKESIASKGLEKKWKALVQESKKLGLHIIIDKKIFLKNFKILDEKEVGENIFEFLMERLGVLKKRVEEKEDVPKCPKCDNILFMSGYTILDPHTTFYYSCTSCGSSFEFDGYGFYEIPKKDQLREIEKPNFEMIRFCIG
jgi:hypothetical protein